jgi:hypothetical protein
MTTAPNIEMIASSLRHCSLTGGAGGSGRRRGGGTRRREGGDDSDGVTVELNSEVALPYHWEQCLDIRVRPSVRPPVAALHCTSYFTPITLTARG